MADSITNEALITLTTAMQSLLPDLGPNGPKLAVMTHPTQIELPGLSGFVGMNDDPHGEIFGRIIHATVEVSVTANSEAERTSAIAQVLSAFLAADRTMLRQKGILRLSVETIPGGGTSTEQDRIYSVLYEFLKKPESAEGTIQQIPINVSVK